MNPNGLSDLAAMCNGKSYHLPLRTAARITFAYIILVVISRLTMLFSVYNIQLLTLRDGTFAHVLLATISMSTVVFSTLNF